MLYQEMPVFSEIHKTYKYTVWAECRILYVKPDGTHSNQ